MAKTSAQLKEILKIHENTIIKMFNDRIEKLKKNNNIIEKIAELKDRSRRNNLRFVGIEESENETWEESEEKVRETLRNKLKIQEHFVIDRAHRVGKKEPRENRKKRSIVVRFLNYKDKAIILNKYNKLKLWNEWLYINEDFSEYTTELQKKFFKDAKELRSKGVFIDLANAFDTIDHEILIKNLQYYGITGNVLNRITNYLSNRKQYDYVDSN
ncbi:uncharacterized protein LOC136085553 [Hydra vulgaris]|uniref:Uncharacterized protein LOC136085553 n=1 Tax=Hydra vulgaris TaxID=6087 RepID=A0ABM4CMC1_HYDVU